MSKINYQALREAAERAIPAMERLLMLPADDDLLSEQELKDYGVDIDALNAFKFLTGPETVLALLDERERNQQYIKRRDQENEDIALTVGRLRVELEAAEKRIAELEAREISLPERSSMLHRTDFHDDYQTVMAYKVSEVIDAIRATGIRIKGDAGEQNDEKP
ncbi:ead/Ea22-like family protein [Escherichia coli]